MNKLIKKVLKKSLIFGIITCTLLSCSEEETTQIPDRPEGEIEDTEEISDESNTDQTLITYFSFVAPSNIGDENTEAWIIIHDDNGNLLDFSKYSEGQTISFKKPRNQLDTIATISFTNLIHITYNSGERASIGSFTGIPKEIVWNTNPTTANKSVPNRNQDRTGQFYNITVNNAPGIDRFSIYSETALGATAEFGINDLTNPFQRNNLELMTDASYLFFLADLENNLKYIIFNPPSNSESIVFNYEDFLDYDNVLVTDLPPNNYLFTVSRGRSEWNSGRFGLEKSIELRFDSPSESKIGYIDDFPGISTVFEIRLPNNYDYYLEEHGGKLEQINILPRPFFQVTDSTMSDFTFDTDLPFKRKVIQWTNQKSETSNTTLRIDWSVNGDETLVTKRMGKIPDEILEQYPNLNFDEISLDRTLLFTKAESYADFLSRMGAANGNGLEISHPETLEFLRIY